VPKSEPKLEPDSLDANPEMDHSEKSNRRPQWSLLGPILSAKNNFVVVDKKQAHF
jgi:hypothetical protein